MPEPSRSPQHEPSDAACSSTPLEILWLPGRWAVCRLDAATAVPGWCSAPEASMSALTSITRTSEELSIVAPEQAVPNDVRAERGWAACRVAGTLDFSMVGILARLTGALADAGISVFAISTFDTDYLLVKEADQPQASQVLAHLT